MLELISMDLLSRTKSTPHALIGGILLGPGEWALTAGGYKTRANRSLLDKVTTWEQIRFPWHCSSGKSPLPPLHRWSPRPYTVAGAASRSTMTSSPMVLDFSLSVLPGFGSRSTTFFKVLDPTSLNPSRSPAPKFLTVSSSAHTAHWSQSDLDAPAIPYEKA
jgi:hypothetical protein